MRIDLPRIGSREALPQTYQATGVALPESARELRVKCPFYHSDWLCFGGPIPTSTSCLGLEQLAV